MTLVTSFKKNLAYAVAAICVFSAALVGCEKDRKSKNPEVSSEVTGVWVATRFSDDSLLEYNSRRNYSFVIIGQSGRLIVQEYSGTAFEQFNFGTVRMTGPLQAQMWMSAEFYAQVLKDIPVTDFASRKKVEHIMTIPILDLTVIDGSLLKAEHTEVAQETHAANNHGRRSSGTWLGADRFRRVSPAVFNSFIQSFEEHKKRENSSRSRWRP